MGTNYYARVDICSSCNKPDSEIHIGKSSMGWPFAFRSYPPSKWNEWGIPEGLKQILVEYDDWKELIFSDRVKVFDEYGGKHEKDDFIALVESKKDLNPDSPDYGYTDSKGYRFIEGEFC